MAIITLRNGKQIGDGKKPYIVAELNSSHNGSVDIAKKMIDAAKYAHCDAIKFQSWSAESLYSVNYYRNNPIAERLVRKFSLSEADLFELCEYCRKIGIDFSSTPYSKEEVDFLAREDCASFIKIASMDINNIPFLKYIASKGMPIVLSTGMATIDEIDEAVNTIEREGNLEICILHCVSIYPVPSTDVNLYNIKTLKERYPEKVIGYSDHTIGYDIASASVALGASIIEKHFTLDNKKTGWDNQMATEPDDMLKLCLACENVWNALGSTERIVSNAELEQRKHMRRSITASKDIKGGNIISLDDLDAKRSGDGTGIPPTNFYSIAGKRTKHLIKAGEIITYDDLEN